jgi:hypothetical protein
MRHFQNGVRGNQMQLIRNTCVDQVSEDEKYTVGSWKLVYAFTKNLDF